MLLVLWGLWELVRWIWVREAWTWPFPVNDTTMPHIHTIFQALGEPAQLAGPAADHDPAARRVVHGEGSARRLRARRHVRVRARDRARALAPRAARVPALHRRLADDPDPRRRADGRRLAQVRLAVGRGDRRVPDVLPGDDQHAARAAVGGAARARADALVRCEPLAGALAPARPDVAALPLHRARRSARPRASSARSSASSRARSRAASAARSSTSTSTTRSRPRISGRPTWSRPASGSRSSS